MLFIGEVNSYSIRLEILCGRHVGLIYIADRLPQLIEAMDHSVIKF